MPPTIMTIEIKIGPFCDTKVEDVRPDADFFLSPQRQGHGLSNLDIARVHDRLRHETVVLDNILICDRLGALIYSS